MTGYGIPLFPIIGDYDGLYYDLDEGYIRNNTEMWYGLTGDDPEFHELLRGAQGDSADWNVYDDWTRKDLIRFLTLNDIYLNNRAKKIQRWLRSFEELPPCCPCPE